MGFEGRGSNITLIGMPGAGKSTLGIVLAKKIGYRFVDTDLLIQEGAQCLLSDIIEQKGVEGFISVENSILAGLSCERHVIATGGSAVYGEQGMENLRRLGPVLFIDISLPEVRTRIHTDLLTRGVVIRKGSTLEDLYNERHPLYERYADLTVHTDGMHTLDAVELLRSELEKAGIV